MLVLVGRAQAESPANEALGCLRDRGYEAAYREIRSYRVGYGGVSGVSVSGEGRTRIEAAAALHRNVSVLTQHVQLKRSGVVRLRRWSQGLDAKSQIAWYVEQIAAQTEREADAVEAVAAAVAAAPAKLFEEGPRALAALMRKYPRLAVRWDDGLDHLFSGVPWEDRVPVHEAADAAHRHFLQHKVNVDAFFTAPAESDAHAAFRPDMTWFGAGLRPPSPGTPWACPKPVESFFAILGPPDGMYRLLLDRSLSDLTRISQAVYRITARSSTISCLRPMPRAEVHFQRETRILEHDVFFRPSSCWDHWIGRYFRRSGEGFDVTGASDEAVLSAIDRELSAAEKGKHIPPAKP
jgi:hypothetical protein